MVRLKNLRSFIALLGPSRFDCTASVMPRMAASPCLTMPSAGINQLPLSSGGGGALSVAAAR
jgi:hypothetical protein